MLTPIRKAQLPPQPITNRTLERIPYLLVLQDRRSESEIDRRPVPVDAAREERQRVDDLLDHFGTGLRDQRCFGRLVAGHETEVLPGGEAGWEKRFSFEVGHEELGT